MQSQKQQNDLCSFPNKPFNITVIQVYAPTSNAEEAEVEWFYEDLQDLLELIPKKEYVFCPFHYQIRSVAQSCPTLCDPMNHSMPGLPVHHQLLEFHSGSHPLSQ